MPFGGLEVIESLYAVQPGKPVTVRRTWRERLFTWPWRPWLKTRIYTPIVPAAYMLNERMLVAHPAFLAELRRAQSDIDARGREEER